MANVDQNSKNKVVEPLLTTPLSSGECRQEGHACDLGSFDVLTPAAIEVEDFSFAYPQTSEGVGPLSWKVEQGSFQLLVGSTGSGKTTLLRCMKPSITPAGKLAGSLRVFGQQVATLEVRQAACLIGYVAQSPENQMVCDTVWHELAFGLENLGVSPEAMRRRVAEVAHFFGIEPWFRRAVANLSGGQKQIVNLASVLVMQPRLLLLDEPTAQLDPVAEKNFLHALFRVNRELGITVVVATHSPEAMADYATSAVELAGGTLSQVPLSGFAPAVLDVEPSCAAGKKPPSAFVRDCRKVSSVIAVKDAFVRYAREGDWVLRGCDLGIEKGSIHALVGGNGSGKSTLLRYIAGVLKGERGQVTNVLKQRQAFLPQDPKTLFVCDTVKDELLEWQKGCGYSDDEVAAALESFGLVRLALHHPYDLSGGQQQKLALAKLLLTSPSLMLLDEPTKGLDAESKCVVARILIERAAAGVTIVLSTHDLTFAALIANTASMLFDGEITCTEPADEFFANNIFYRPGADRFSRLWLGSSPMSAGV